MLFSLILSTIGLPFVPVTIQPAGRRRGEGMPRYEKRLTAHLAAERLGVAYSTMLRWCREGKITAEKGQVWPGSDRKEWLIPEKAVHELIVKALESTTPAPWQKRIAKQIRPPGWYPRSQRF